MIYSETARMSEIHRCDMVLSYIHLVLDLYDYFLYISLFI